VGAVLLFVGTVAWSAWYRRRASAELAYLEDVATRPD
jgi:hypothetical protein